MTDLRTLTLASFAERIGEPFAVTGGTLTLAEAEAAGGGAEREAFSLVFEGAPGVALPQGIHALEHEELGRLELFLVPLSPTQYQSIFA